MIHVFNRNAPDSVAIVDEIVACTESITDEDHPFYGYYRGRLTEWPGGSLYNASADYGLWTAASKGGTKYTIGVGLPSSGQACVDHASGEVYTSISVTLYARYLGYGREWTPRENERLVCVPGLLDFAASTEVYRLAVAEKTRFSEIRASLAVAPVGGTLTLAVGKASGETAGSASVAFTTGVREVTTAIAAPGLIYQRGERIVVTAPLNYLGAQNLNLALIRG